MQKYENKAVDILLNYLIEEQDNWSTYQKTVIANELAKYLFGDSKSGRKTMDIKKDFRLIYCAFLKYGIDIIKEDIHFAKFKWILEDIALTQTGLNEVIKMRTMKIPSFADPETASAIRKNKRLYSVLTKEEIKKKNAMAINAFMGASKAYAERGKA